MQRANFEWLALLEIAHANAHELLHHSAWQDCPLATAASVELIASSNEAFGIDVAQGVGTL
jgi:hypothetical protein